MQEVWEDNIPILTNSERAGCKPYQDDTMKLSIKFLTLTIAMTALTISHAKLGDIGMRHLQFLQSSECEIYSQDNKNRPDYLTLEYIPQGSTPGSKAQARQCTWRVFTLTKHQCEKQGW
jgi:hypothetical protein